MDCIVIVRAIIIIKTLGYSVHNIMQWKFYFVYKISCVRVHHSCCFFLIDFTDLLNLWLAEPASSPLLVLGYSFRFLLLCSIFVVSIYPSGFLPPMLSFANYYDIRLGIEAFSWIASSKMSCPCWPLCLNVIRYWLRSFCRQFLLVLLHA